MRRIVGTETLDQLQPDDPAAMQSRRDLMRVHRVMGTRTILSRGWRVLVSPERAASALRVLELGAGDGTLLLRLAASLAPAWPRVQLSLLDRHDAVAPGTLAAFARLGWSVQVLVTDVQAWATAHQEPALGLPDSRWDLITCTLFLHHFNDTGLGLLLAAAASRCDRFFACEPRRSPAALLASHLVGALAANAVTRGDAVLSVRAGFQGDELSALWMSSGGAWRVREGRAGPFCHCFSARRLEVER